MSRFTRRRGDESGLFLVVTAVAVLTITVFMALVIDLGQIRTDRRVNKTVVDTAVLAGLGVLHLGPWSGVCRASAYLKANSPGFSQFDAGSEEWFQLSAPLNKLTSSPCLNPTISPFVNLCLPGVLGIPNTSTWGRLRATAGGGRFTIEIQSGYPCPTPPSPRTSSRPATRATPSRAPATT